MDKLFAVSCKINEDSEILRERLRNIGYNDPYPMPEPKEGNCLYTSIRGIFNTYEIGYQEEIENIIDCGKDVDLFLALASLTVDPLDLDGQMVLYKETVNGNGMRYKDDMYTWNFNHYEGEVTKARYYVYQHMEKVRKLTSQEIIEVMPSYKKSKKMRTCCFHKELL